MTYREMAIKTVKIIGQELIDRADEMIPKIDGIKNINIWIRIPSRSDDPTVIPDYEVSTELFPKTATFKAMLDMMDVDNSPG